MANGNLLCDPGSSDQCSVISQRSGLGWEVGGRFKREGVHVYIHLIHFIVQQRLTRRCRAIILQLERNENALCVVQRTQHIAISGSMEHTLGNSGLLHACKKSYLSLVITHSQMTEFSSKKTFISSYQQTPVELGLA